MGQGAKGKGLRVGPEAAKGGEAVFSSLAADASAAREHGNAPRAEGMGQGAEGGLQGAKGKGQGAEGEGEAAKGEEAAPSSLVAVTSAAGPTPPGASANAAGG